MKQYRLILVFLVWIQLGQFAQAQSNKKTMTPEVYDIWNTINDVQISNNGDWVIYKLAPRKGDGAVKLYNTRKKTTLSFDRAKDAQLSFNNKFLAFLISAPHDTIQALKRAKTEKDDFPKDTLGFYDFKSKRLIKIPRVKSFSIPEENGNLLAYHLEVKENDTLSLKQETKKTGTRLIIKSFENLKEDTIPYVIDYMWNKKGTHLAASSTGKDSTEFDQLLIYNTKKGVASKIYEEEDAEIDNLVFSEQGDALSFTSDVDSTESFNQKIDLFLWQAGQRSAKNIANERSAFLKDNWRISEHHKPYFSKEGKYLNFKVSPNIAEQDTSLLDEEIVDVEVWHYEDAYLHTQQKINLDRDRKRGYTVLYDIRKNKSIQLGTKEIPNVRLTDKASKYAIGFNQDPYAKLFSWEGIYSKDVYLMDIEKGNSKKILSKEEGNISLSPKGKYAIWYSRPDSTWKAINTAKSKTITLTKDLDAVFYDERNDRPMHPWSYGTAGWLNDDDKVIINDRYDLWLIDPDKPQNAKRLTDGRKDKLMYRYIQLDDEVESFPSDTTLLLHIFDERDKSAGYASLNLRTNKLTQLDKGDYLTTRRVYKAKNTDDYVFTKQNMEMFPNLIHTKDNFKTQEVFSDANPQQEEYKWGTAELVKWNSKDGTAHEGMLFRPDDFDASKTYPLIVNFYEKSSDRLNRHRAPFAHRSTINYSYYLSKGYVIFNPDVHYKNGAPGESCYNSVMSGIDEIIKLGFIDEDNIGVQGHSWGGYQIAHLITKTDRFKCAESGAPVVNMISAYGGIRWGSGLSRMFQYEHTQSRIGGTIWNNLDQYMENSPIFNIDKINTPVLILHNDEDGAVPWYQGIEFFVAMRRLNKKAWFLNYNGEPHWPVKRQNRLDFNIRMEQFFDHYLKGAPMPKWMKSGVPAIEKGILQGLELDDNN